MFDFLKKKNNDGKSLHDYLSLYPGWFLYDEAIKSLICDISNDECFAPLSIKTTSKVEWMTWSPHYKRFCKDIAAIPKKYYEERVSAIELLEIATGNGHFDAPFVLFLIYEYGLDKLTDIKQHSIVEMENNREREKAAVYRELARSRDSSFEKAFTWIENNHSAKEGLPLEHYEITTSRMVVPDDKTKEILGVFEPKFSALGVFVLCGLAQYGSAYTAAHLAIMISLILKFKESRQEEYPEMGEFFKYSDKDLNDGFFAIANRLLKKAADGDAKAALALEHWQIDLAK